MGNILFRAKSTESGEWIEFDLKDGKCPQIDERTVCLFTGLYTKSGQKVWEKDIIQHPYGAERAAVEYGIYRNSIDLKEALHCGFYTDWKHKNLYRKDLGYWTELGAEVIGNIIDAPELLEGGELE